MFLSLLVAAMFVSKPRRSCILRWDRRDEIHVISEIHLEPWGFAKGFRGSDWRASRVDDGLHAIAILQVTKAVAVSTATASLLYSGNAMAAQEMVSQIAESDNRLGVILTLFVPALGWVGFNMLQPLTNQVRSKLMNE